MLLLEAIVVSGGLVEDVFQFLDAAEGVLSPPLLGIRPLLLGFGLLPQRVVAAEQVVEEPPAFGRVVRKVRCHAHDMDYTIS